MTEQNRTSEWQPIETAPTDEEQILWWGGPEFPQSFAVIWFPTFKECFETHGSMWMPLPEPPVS